MTLRATGLLLLTTLLLALSSAASAKGRLGFAVQASSDGPATSTLKEVKISAVRPNGPAEKAGLRTGDAVTEIAGQRISGLSGVALKKHLGNVKQGEHLKLLVLRAGKPITIDIVAGPDQ